MIDAVDASKFPVLDLRALVIDHEGYTLRNLDGRHLALWEDETLLEVDSIAFEKDPVSVVLALDSSGTMVPAADQVRRTAGDILRILDPKDAVSVLEFSSEARFLARFGEERGRAIQALAALVPYGPTALWDGLYRSLLELSGRPGKRNVIVISDGKDQNKADTGPGSRRTREDVVTLARRLAIPVHGIALGPEAMKAEIARVAKETGGRAFRAPRAEHLEDLYRRLVAHLEGRIRMVAKTARPKLDGARRKLVLRVRAGESAGEASARYAAPGRFVVDVGPVSFTDRRELPLASREVRVRDPELAVLEPGDRAGLLAFVEKFFREDGPTGP